ncbi:hypothetical protein VKT23_018289 [Stygiomarasmius scandens]|uniref:F-box domain-containing protein n=1 Tax=Marasmiellus scandens TaxID=2682957 RepID=A0ABR1ITE5_9AGAR
MDSECHISQIPDELLIEIFSFCLPFISPDFLENLASDGEVVQLVDPHVALRLSHVCSRWRLVALTTSSLWSQMILLAPRLAKTQEHRVLQWTKYYIENSREQPLEIVLQSTDNYVRSSFASILYLGSALVNESRRWSKVYLSLLPSEMRNFPFPTVLPLLEFLHLHSAYNKGAPAIPEAPFFFAPRLKELWLTEINIPSTSVKSLLETSPQLDHIVSPYCHIETALQILSRARPNTIADLTLSVDYEPVASSAVVSQVGRLITTSSSDCPNPLVDSLSDLLLNISSMPALHTLDLEGDDVCCYPFPHVPLISLLSRRLSDETPITALSLKFWNLEDVHLIQILSFLPSLDFLTVDETLPAYMYNSSERKWTLSGAFLQALQAPDGGLAQNCLVPRLTHIDLTFDEDLEVEGLMLIDMIQSRRRSPSLMGLSEVARLDRVRISVNEELLELEHIQVLEGMDNLVLELA